MYDQYTDSESEEDQSKSLSVSSKAKESLKSTNKQLKLIQTTSLQINENKDSPSIEHPINVKVEEIKHNINTPTSSKSKSPALIQPSPIKKISLKK
ncbi:hypothetical protein Mgra_00009973 [Meloidogyne graminicola]|uniref:Uncharacterized protein n=1 Tax=Meloidogyne graminicola TaxID=189291 RepID=A0A8S9ZD52_9BILA|nr:hypothetical protein Mgra_00009973 [Meloidogyne graminicola]